MHLLNIVQVSIFSFFFLLYITAYVVTTNDKNEQIKHTLNQEIENLDNNYKVSSERFKILSDNFYNMVLKKEEVLKLFHKAKQAKTEFETASVPRRII